jgi:Lrp/AsnC family transcriptional regulator, regulator for asnA, asnC and gidA
MDEKDRRILAELQRNSRETIRNIAKRTGMRPSTVHQRIRRLEKEVISQYTVKLDRKKSGRGFVGYILVQADQKLPQSLVNNPHVAEVCGITGEYDLLMKLEFETIDGFNEFLLRLRENRMIRKTLTMVATVMVKE